MKNIFDILFNKNIYFSILRARISSKIKSIENSAFDYFIIVKKGDLKNNEAIKLGFRDSYCQEYKNIIERTMNENEINIFKDIYDKFIMVQCDENGRVFEIKNKSFKTYYQTPQLTGFKT
jgi:hypothetical protein